MTPSHRKVYEAKLYDIDAVTEPSMMTPKQALEFLELLSTDIQCRIDGLKDDMRNRGQD